MSNSINLDLYVFSLELGFIKKNTKINFRLFFNSLFGKFFYFNNNTFPSYFFIVTDLFDMCPIKRFFKYYSISFNLEGNKKKLNNWNVFINNFNLFLLNLILGSIEKIEITGYARKAWISSKKNIKFKVGMSYINKFNINKNMLVNVFKKRVITIFSIYQSKSFTWGLIFFSLKPADPYKAGGIKWLTKDIFIKNSSLSTKV